jgi:hypothetical protein
MRTITIAPFAGSIAEHSDRSPKIINKIIKKSAPKIIAGLLGTLVWNAFLVWLFYRFTAAS